MSNQMTLALARTHVIASIIESPKAHLIPEWFPPEIQDLKAARSMTLNDIFELVTRRIDSAELVNHKIAIGTKQSSEDMIAVLSKLLAD
jgi:hypothetical protein